MYCETWSTVYVKRLTCDMRRLCFYECGKVDGGFKIRKTRQCIHIWWCNTFFRRLLWLPGSNIWNIVLLTSLLAVGLVLCLSKF